MFRRATCSTGIHPGITLFSYNEFPCEMCCNYRHTHTHTHLDTILLPLASLSDDKEEGQKRKEGLMNEEG